MILKKVSILLILLVTKLKYKYQGFWSRRITQEHRLIYRLVNDVIIIVSLKGHYDD